MRATREKCSSLLNYVFDLCQQLSSILMADGRPSCYVLLLGRIQGCIPNSYEYNILHGPSISAYDVLWGTRFILEDTIAYDRLFVSFLCQSVAWFVLDGFPVFVIIGVFDSCC